MKKLNEMVIVKIYTSEKCIVYSYNLHTGEDSHMKTTEMLCLARLWAEIADLSLTLDVQRISNIFARKGIRNAVILRCSRLSGGLLNKIFFREVPPIGTLGPDWSPLFRGFNYSNSPRITPSFLHESFPLFQSCKSC